MQQQKFLCCKNVARGFYFGAKVDSSRKDFNRSLHKKNWPQNSLFYHILVTRQ